MNAKLLVAIALIWMSACRRSVCPNDGRLVGNVPPKGSEQWCEHQNHDGNFVRHGKWTAWRREGMKLMEVSYENGLRDGPVSVWYDNGQAALRGRCEHNWARGEWSLYTSDGLRISRVVFSKDHRQFLDEDGGVEVAPPDAGPGFFQLEAFLGREVPGAAPPLYDRYAEYSDTLSCDYLDRIFKDVRAR